jgi:hypothetical protein
MRAPLFVVSILAASLTACQTPTPEKIETWKGTQKGPGKLRDVVKDDGADPHLRGLALAALVEIGMGSEAMRDFSEAQPAKKGAIVHEAVEPLTTTLGASLTSPTVPTQAQRSAKDALFELRGDATAADKPRIDDLLVKWTTLDLGPRASLGGESTEKILRAIGPAAAPALVQTVTTTESPLAASLLGELGDPSAQSTAAASLIARAKHGASPSETDLAAIGFVGGPSAEGYLMEVARGSAPADTRQKALYALAHAPRLAGSEKVLAGAQAIAVDAHAPGDVREAAFQVLEKIGPAAVGTLVHLFTDANTTVRERAMEAALKAGGAAAVKPVLAALPEDRTWKSDDLNSFVVHDLTLLGKDGPAALAEAARHPPALGQVAALRALAKVGSGKDAAACGLLVSDTSAPRSLSPATTVGKEAMACKAALASRP